MRDAAQVIAGPKFDGLGLEICIFPLIVVAAILYIVAKDFRLTMKHSPQQRGTLYWVAVAVVVFATLDVLWFTSRFWRR